jgi:hypothetical protein
MNHSNQYKGNNPIPGPKRYGNSRNDTAVATGTEVVAKADAPASTVQEKVTITSIDAKVDALPDANVMTAANASEMAAQAAPAKPGTQIVTDPAEPAVSTRPTS